MVFTVFRKLLPKKYRVKDKKIRSLISDFNNVSTNLAKSGDSIGEVLVKARNVFAHFYEKYNHVQTTYQELKVFCEDLEEPHEVVYNHSFVQLVMPNVEPVSMKKAQELSAYTNVMEATYLFKGKEVVLYVVRTDGYSSSTVTFDNHLIVPKGFNPMCLINTLFQNFENKLYLTYKDGVMHYSKLDHSGKDYLLNQKLFDSLLTEIKSFRDRGIQRSYIIPGPPGTGKTSFCVELSLATTGRVVKIDSTVFTHLGSSSTRSILEHLDCDFLIVDDVDRIKQGDLSTFLYALETLKGYERKPTLLATCNNIKALDDAIIRPGRFDDIIDEEFNYPNEKERKVFFVTMLNLLGVNDLTTVQVTKLVKVTQGMSQAYLKEYCEQLRVENRDFDAVIKKIERRMKYLVKSEEAAKGKASKSSKSSSSSAETGSGGGVPDPGMPSGDEDGGHTTYAKKAASNDNAADYPDTDNGDDDIIDSGNKCGDPVPKCLG